MVVTSALLHSFFIYAAHRIIENRESKIDRKEAFSIALPLHSNEVSSAGVKSRLSIFKH